MFLYGCLGSRALIEAKVKSYDSIVNNALPNHDTSAVSGAPGCSESSSYMLNMGVRFAEACQVKPTTLKFHPTSQLSVKIRLWGNLGVCSVRDTFLEVAPRTFS